MRAAAVHIGADQRRTVGVDHGRFHVLVAKEFPVLSDKQGWTVRTS